MNDREKIELEVLTELLEDVTGMHGNYIVEHIKDEIERIKDGV